MRQTGRPSVILRHGVSAIFHTALVFSIFMLVRGHNGPGGGFVGGLIAAGAFVLKAADEGAGSVRDAVPLRPAALLGLGLLTMLATGVGGMVTGGAFLEAGVVEFDLPLFGSVEAGSALAFDVGVYVAVVGVGLSILEWLGGEGEA